MVKQFTTLLMFCLLLVPGYAFPVENYANAKFTALSSAPCIYPQTNMIRQFDRFDGTSYPNDERFMIVRHIGEPAGLAAGGAGAIGSRAGQTVVRVPAKKRPGPRPGPKRHLECGRITCAGCRPRTRDRLRRRFPPCRGRWLLLPR